MYIVVEIAINIVNVYPFICFIYTLVYNPSILYTNDMYIIVAIVNIMIYLPLYREYYRIYQALVYSAWLFAVLLLYM